MSHAFGELLSIYRVRKRGLSQSRLAELAGYDPALLARMAQGKKDLTGPSGRERVVRLLSVLQDEGVLATLEEANALMAAASLPPLYGGLPAELALMRRLRGQDADVRMAPLRPRTNLPQALTSFIGRDQEVGQLAVRIPHSRLLTLTGAGGCGKTRLSIEVARKLMDTFPDGVWRVELAPLEDPALVLGATAEIFGLREQVAHRAMPALVTYLEHKRLLLILDNCEHLIGACAELAETLLQRCSQLHVVATSRELLQVAGEVAWRVPPMARVDGMRLFEHRAKVARPGFVLTERNAQAVGDICDQLDGMPLALELAAARLRVLSVEQIAVRLDDRFRLLTGGTRTALPRHQSLRATLDWSYDLLSDAERALFQRLSVFAGGWTLEAAEAVCGDQLLDVGGLSRDLSPPIPRGDIMNLLTGLVDKSLAGVGEAESRGGQVRYHLLETLRQYGADRVREVGQAEGLHDRHVAHFVSFAEVSDAACSASKYLPWKESIDAELDNLRAALAWCREHAPDPACAAAGLRIATALAQYWDMNRYYQESLQWLSDALAWDRRHPFAVRAPLGVHAKALFYAWLAASRCGEWRRLNELVAWSEACLADSQVHGDQNGMAYCLLVQACDVAHRQDSGRARELAGKSLELFDAVADQRGMWLAVLTLSPILLNQHAHSENVAMLERYVRRFQDLGDRGYYWDVLRMLARELIAMGETERATSLCERLLALSKIAVDPIGAWCILSDLEVANQPGALALAEQYLEHQRQVGDEQTVAGALHKVGQILIEGGEYARARQPLDTCVALMRTQRITWGVYSDLALALCDRSIAARCQDDHQQALAGFEESERLSVERGDVWLAATALFHRGRTFMEMGEIDLAVADFAKSIKRAQVQRAMDLLPALLAAISEVLCIRDEVAPALRLAGAAARFEREMRLAPANLRIDYDRVLAVARGRLNDPAMAVAWREGQAMTLDQAVADALRLVEREQVVWRPTTD